MKKTDNDPQESTEQERPTQPLCPREPANADQPDAVSNFAAATVQAAAGVGPQSAPVLDPSSALAAYWRRPLSEAATVDLRKAAPELSIPAMRERHRIYCHLLMALLCRYWNGNKSGPVGIYPQRKNQLESGQNGGPFRYRGDMQLSADDRPVCWDRYLGHNIAGLAVDGNGEVIDFDFNHNDIFRSSTEHAEARLVRRLFSLTNVSDSWQTGRKIPGKSKGFSLKDVTVYTSLESCAQCSGVMSLGRVRQVVYLQTDPGTYTVGNLMYNLAGQDPGDHSYLAAIPVAAAAIDLEHFSRLDGAYEEFYRNVLGAQKRGDRAGAFFISPDNTVVDYAPSITSFLCTDAAYDIFRDGADAFHEFHLDFPNDIDSSRPGSWTNGKCLKEAQRFYQYANIEGYRGSPHKL